MKLFIKMFCLYQECGHSATLNLCSFRKLPSDECRLKIWKRNAKISQKVINKSENPCLCSCHFETEMQNPMHYLVYRSRKIESNYEVNDFQFLTSFDDDLFEPPNNDDNHNEIENNVHVEVIDLTHEEFINLSLACPLVTSSPVSSPTTKIQKEIESVKLENEELKTANEKLRTENEKLKLDNAVLGKRRFDLSCIEDSNEKIFAHTGLPSKEVFDILYETLTKVEFNYYMGWEVVTIPKRSQLLMTLMKLRMDLRYYDLAERFKCSETTVSNVFRTWLLLMHEHLFLGLMKQIPSRFKNQECLPTSFQSFHECRIVLDCTEMFIDKPLKMNRQKAVFSPYKHHVTIKPLIGVAPNGLLTYASELYTGSSSDKKIVESCGICKELTVGDLVLADKGFLIEDVLPYGVNLNMPPFLMTPQFTREQVFRTETIARARIHVERKINTIKNFRILRYIPAELFTLATEIFQVCAALTNFQNPVIREVGMKY